MVTINPRLIVTKLKRSGTSKAPAVAHLHHTMWVYNTNLTILNFVVAMEESGFKFHVRHT